MGGSFAPRRVWCQAAPGRAPSAPSSGWAHPTPPPTHRAGLGQTRPTPRDRPCSRRPLDLPLPRARSPPTPLAAFVSRPARPAAGRPLEPSRQPDDESSARGSTQRFRVTPASAADAHQARAVPDAPHTLFRQVAPDPEWRPPPRSPGCVRGSVANPHGFRAHRPTVAAATAEVASATPNPCRPLATLAAIDPAPTYRAAALQ
jgi:hypothetical protein